MDTHAPTTLIAPTTCPKRTDNLDKIINCSLDCIDCLLAQSQQHYAIMAKTNQQILAYLQELVQIMPQFFVILSQYLNDPRPTQLHDKPHSPATALVPANSQIQLWTTDTSSLPLPLVANASTHAPNHVMKECMQHSQHIPCHLLKQQLLYCMTRSCCLLTSPHLTQYKTQDMFCMPMKHVCFKTPALCSPGPRMFWPKEDMCPP